jgi:hypothetical protein
MFVLVVHVHTWFPYTVFQVDDNTTMDEDIAQQSNLNRILAVLVIQKLLCQYYTRRNIYTIALLVASCCRLNNTSCSQCEREFAR